MTEIFVKVAVGLFAELVDQKQWVNKIQVEVTVQENADHC